MSKVAMIGATGAVGTEVVRTLVAMDSVESVILLGRREFTAVTHPKIAQYQVDVLDPSTYEQHLNAIDAAICTLGVGQPSKVTKEQFSRIDRDAVLDFGRASREAGAAHFQLLASVGANSGARSFYLRSKGQLEDGLHALGFERLSLFHPSMILTPENRYGIQQAFTLTVWPLLKPLLAGPLRKFRGIEVERLGRAMALNLEAPQSGREVLEWDQFVRLSGGKG